MTSSPREERFDYQLREFLTWQAADVDSAPTAAGMALRLRARPGRSLMALVPSPVWWLLVALLIAVVAGAAVVGSVRRPPNVPRLPAGNVPTNSSRPTATAVPNESVRPSGYKAVYVTADQSGQELTVTGVDNDGAQTEIAHFTGLTFQPEGAALSAYGLLAVRALENDHLLWHIFDLTKPSSPPVIVSDLIQDYDGPRPGGPADRGPTVFWGPGDQLAIPWNAATDGSFDGRLAFVDGRTGASENAKLPTDPSLRLRRYWAADGSGVLMSNGGPAADLELSILRRDGSVGQFTGEVFAGDGHARNVRADGTGLGWSSGSVYQEAPGARSHASLADLEGLVSDAAWTADGTGIWAATAFPDKLELIRASSPSTLTPVANLSGSLVAALPNSNVTGEFIGLAPDDSMAVVQLGRWTYGTDGWTGGTGVTAASATVNTATGAEFDLTGAFAGWWRVGQ